ncbi:hypothetical protein [Sphingomonas sp. G-3-2-10]|uniref:hypothetical protein n=1 Tax=Sphingomonas sp. G-3-2-10 TaxID=2728838 RepID=UPI00146ED8D8|nr:hypothetical protein [Sphingomonas sp. G-3-2-10]NML05401.1 hypothetical protein [Sphingomonas sp. G-3-2-10]
MSADTRSAPFSARMILILVTIAVVATAAFLFLSAYERDLTPVRDPGAHAFSKSAVGFSGAVELVRLTGGESFAARRESELATRGLVVVTPIAFTQPEQLRLFLERREERATLIVLPKRITRELREHRGWVRQVAVAPPEISMNMLKGTAEATLYGTGKLRSLRGPKLKTLIEGEGGGALLAQIGDTPHYLLADPDALNNMGLKTIAGVTRAKAILDRVNREAELPIVFDTTLAGFANNPSLLRLAFEPPFLPFSLCIAFATLLAILHATRRFGPAAHEERKVAFGKRALAENGAALLRLARRRHRTGERYAALTRDAVASATGAPPGLSGEALDRYLDKLDRTGELFTAIAARAADAPDTRRLMSAVRDLYSWRKTVTRDH